MDPPYNIIFEKKETLNVECWLRIATTIAIRAVPPPFFFPIEFQLHQTFSFPLQSLHQSCGNVSNPSKKKEKKRERDKRCTNVRYFCPSGRWHYSVFIGPLTNVPALFDVKIMRDAFMRVSLPLIIAQNGGEFARATNFEVASCAEIPSDIRANIHIHIAYVYI